MEAPDNNVITVDATELIDIIFGKRFLKRYSLSNLHYCYLFNLEKINKSYLIVVKSKPISSWLN